MGNEEAATIDHAEGINDRRIRFVEHHAAIYHEDTMASASTELITRGHCRMGEGVLELHASAAIRWHRSCVSPDRPSFTTSHARTGRSEKKSQRSADSGTSPDTANAGRVSRSGSFQGRTRRCACGGRWLR
jgi:hypothetical protein